MSPIRSGTGLRKVTWEEGKGCGMGRSGSEEGILTGVGGRKGGVAWEEGLTGGKDQMLGGKQTAGLFQLVRISSWHVALPCPPTVVEQFYSRAIIILELRCDVPSEEC